MPVQIDMDRPKSCRYCSLAPSTTCVCTVGGNYRPIFEYAMENKRHPDCPLQEVK